MLEVLWPWVALLLPLPLLARRVLPAAGQAQAPALRIPFFRRWQSLSEQAVAVSGVNRRLPAVLLWLCWVLLLMALSRPTWIGEPVQLPDSGRDLMLAVDISGSMRVEDMLVADTPVRRIDAVKAVATDFLRRRSGDRVGLILFGSNAYVQSPLSFDTATVERFLNEAQIGFAGQETAIGDAIGLAVKRLRERPTDSRVLIVLTDGQDTASTVDPLEAAALAASLDIRIHTIGIGADSMVVPGVLGSRFGNRQVNPSADLDEDTMRAIAGRTGGRYFRARDPQDLVQIYQTIDRLEPVEVSTATYRPRRSLVHIPLLVALALSAGLVLFGSGSAIRRQAAGGSPG
ncbi:VWA domain-containing protein [Chromatocurvus halotolerans]|uniref:Ca-activated chloride channel family protein n=1 Tax=Chromatocurvus halotolerans TaxID=1132028 RepID=A0A4V6NPE1_9GAMM|nr:VWA domain-containing protein [Chromatocurvus halotolerans]TCO75620.1 Ca-activated chloride channel family protein [Chromatocurvus halotolerans]